MTYAVILKTTFWDGFMDRQLRRLRHQAGPGALFVVADETAGPFPVNHDRVLRVSTDTARAAGFAGHPGETELAVYQFGAANPEYEIIFMVEHDCVVTTALAPIAAAMAAETLGFVGEKVRVAPAQWPPGRGAAPFYPPGMEITGRMLGFAGYSRDFALDLQTARLEHADRRRHHGAGADGAWPAAEALVGAEIARRGTAEASLSRFGDTELYRNTPPLPEPLAPRLAAGFAQQVLDTARFLAALPAFNLKAKDIFDPASYAGLLAARCPPEDFLREALRHFARNRDLDGIARARALAVERGADAARNVARAMPATQSSVCEHSRGGDPALDAAGAVSGVITGSHGFHTDFEEQPWWSVDLGLIFPVREVRLYNRLALAERARTLIVTSSTDMTSWVILHDHGNGEAFGGADGRPLRIQLPEPVPIRFLRVSLAGRDYLHLDEVEVYV